jgi:putative ABC transport system ATP-binding protein
VVAHGLLAPHALGETPCASLPLAPKSLPFGLCKALKKSFGNGETKQDVLKGLDFTVAKGEFCVLLGPSGSGKSTLLNILGGIDNADSGEIFIDGDRLADMTKRV